jgi:glycosyltransferase involved in cell wall biosynthesis
MIPTAFYAPLKSPDHAVPSGDRTMARLLLSALRQAGFAPTLASSLRSLDLGGDLQAQQTIREAADVEAGKLIATFRERRPEGRPRLWFTYHCYYKAPDWIGPRVADALDIPYVVAEGSRSARQAEGPWATGHAASEVALDRADCLLVMTPYDAEDLAPVLRPAQSLVELPPFLDASAWKVGNARCQERGEAIRLLTVAMMRPGDKLASYELLSRALNLLPASRRWTLDVIGDGPARGSVEALLSSFGERIRYRGALSSQEELARAYGAADLLVWPAVREAYGMTLLEAQACGCPVLAGREGGVPSVVRDGETGILSAPRDASAFAEALSGLLDRARLAPMRSAACRFVQGERDVSHAAGTLGSALLPLLDRAWETPTQSARPCPSEY